MTVRSPLQTLTLTAMLLAATCIAACNSNGDKTPVPPETPQPAPESADTQPASTQPAARPGLSATPPPPIEEFGQGIVGRVVKVTGNMMPGPGGRPRGKTQALSVPLHIFTGKVKVFAKPDPDHPQLATIAHCQGDGIFRVALAPGRYTVVAEIDGKLYLNCFQGDGTWCTVTVVKDEWTKTDIQDTSEAAF